MRDGLDVLRSLIPPRIGESEAYSRGYDYGLNGANEENCHFSIFSSVENTKEWERGNADGKQERNR